MECENVDESTNFIIFIMKGSTLGTDCNQVELIKLRHPRSEKASVFVFNSCHGTLQEVLTFSQKYRSWFVNNTVKSDGKLYLSTIVDPLFLILPYFFKTDLCSPLEQILYDNCFPDTDKLLRTSAANYISLIADKKDDKWNAWKYNENKTLTWLKDKVFNVAEVIKRKNLNVNNCCVVSKNYVKVEIEENDEIPQDVIRYAHGIVSEYLPVKLSVILQNFLGLPVESVADEKKRKIQETESLNIKKLKRECHETDLASKLLMEEKEKSQKVIRKSAKEVALEKAANKTKNISAYFKKK